MKRLYLLLLLIAAGVPVAACTKDTAPAEVHDAAVAQASVVAPATAIAEAGVDASEPTETIESEVLDAGTDAADAGRRKRRLLDAGIDAAAALVPSAAPAPTAVTAAAPEHSGKRAQMKDDVPYGGASVSAAPILGKRPLPPDDPWARSKPVSSGP